MQHDDNYIPPMLRTREILARASVSESHWWNLERRGHCPVRLRVGLRSRGLPEQLLGHWLAWCLDLRPLLVHLSDDFEMPLWSPDIEVSPHPRGIRMLKLPQVERLVGTKHSCIYNCIAGGAFPRPAPLGRQVRRWAWHEVQASIDARNADLRALGRPDSPWLLPRAQKFDKPSRRRTRVD